MYSLPSSPKSIKGVLEDIFEAYNLVMSKCWAIALLAGVLSGVPVAIFAANGGFQKLDDAITQDMQRLLRGEPSHAASDWLMSLLANKEFWFVAALMSVALTVLSVAAIIRASASINNNNEAIAKHLTRALHLAPRALGIALLYIFATSIGFALLLVPGIIWTISLLFAPVVMVDERRTAIDSLLRSRQLVRGHWWRTSTIVTIAMIAEFFVAAISQSVVEKITQLITHSESATAGFGAAATTFSCMPLQVATLIVVYQDLKLRLKLP